MATSPPFLAYGLGIYSFNRDSVVRLDSVMEVPDKDNVAVYNICSVMITGNPGIMHVINDDRESALTARKRAIIHEYRNGMVK